jgi:phosphopantothenoylcysteine decarboxylase / phosphopantothenate---cysteine ligase
MEPKTRKKLLLGVTGGIAAYKAAELVRALVKDGIDVRVVMTEAACRFVAPATFQALSGQAVFTDLWDARVDDHMAHIALAREADAILIAPASADFIAKLAHGLADDLLSTLCLARSCPLLVAPAMNREMWDQPPTVRNVAQLARDGAILLGPAAGDQACGETGMGRMLEPGEIAADIGLHFAPKPLAGRRVVVTAGPTFEPIDTVRGITNASSGKMGYAMAQAARESGADVTLVSGPTALAVPRGVGIVRVTTAAQMFAAVQAALPGADLFVAVAAVADYTPANPSRVKLKKKGEPLAVELVPTVDILGHVAALPDAPFCIGFAAESENLEQYAQAKRRAKKIPMIAANLVQTAIGGDDSEIVVYDEGGAHPLPRAPKIEQARRLLAHALPLMRAGGRGAATTDKTCTPSTSN